MRKKKVVHLRCFQAAKKRLSAFSLVEMLMALLVASLLLAALAPVMTKRFTGEAVNVGSLGGVIKPPAGSYCWSTTKGGGSDNIEQDANGNRIIKYIPEKTLIKFSFILPTNI